VHTKGGQKGKFPREGLAKGWTESGAFGVEKQDGREVRRDRKEIELRSRCPKIVQKKNRQVDAKGRQKVQMKEREEAVGN